MRGNPLVELGCLPVLGPLALADYSGDTHCRVAVRAVSHILVYLNLLPGARSRGKHTLSQRTGEKKPFWGVPPLCPRPWTGW